MSNLDYTFDIDDYWRMILRRKVHFLIPFVLVVICAIALAFLLPTKYRSEATFLIERQAIPQNLVATTVTGYVQEQIQQIRQRLVAHEAILELAERYALYPEKLANDPRAVVELVRSEIEVEMVDVNASDPDRAGQRVATIAFNVAYTGETPEIAQDVTTALADRYMEIHRAARAERAEEVKLFLDAEADKMAEEIDYLNEQLAGFKQEELRQLPELLAMNLNLFERTDQQIQQTRERTRNIQDQINATQAELSLTEPYEQVVSEQGNVILTGAQRLSALTAEYLRLSARYSAKHPDVVKLNREISVLAEQTGTSARADELMNELTRLQDQLRTARQTYDADHPEVQRLERSVAAVQRGFQTSLIEPAQTDDVQAPAPDNPRYVALKTQLDSLQANLKAEQQRLQDLTSKLEEYEERLYQTPAVERDFKALSRDYENNIAKYRELREKQLQAELAETLETGETAEKFILASPAFLPRTPDSPNRLGIFLIAGVLGFSFGLAAVAIAEYLDSTIRDVRALIRTVGVPPLVVVPQLEASAPTKLQTR